MKNLNEPRKKEEMATKNEAEVVPFDRRAGAETQPTAALLPKRQLEELRGRWSSIQTSFVDEPRKAVEAADKLVASAIKQIEEVFFAQRSNLEKQWSRGDQVSTEDLRVCLQHYRQFFDRLLSLKDGQ